MASKKNKGKAKTTGSRSKPAAQQQNPKTAPAKKVRKNVVHPAGRRKKPMPLLWFAGIIALLVVGRILTIDLPHYLHVRNEATEGLVSAASLKDPGVPALSFAQIQAQKRIIDVHEHIGSADLAHLYIEIMDELGIGKMCLMGSSTFTLTMQESYGFTGYDENNEELIHTIEQYPGRFEAWPTINPEDPDKLEKLKSLVARGATGVKLYIGHGYITNQDTKVHKRNEYMFHTTAIDAPTMFPIYKYCEANYIPLCMHVNPYKGKQGFAEEFIAVLTACPDMKVVCPHLMLSSIQHSRLEEFLRCFPNLYTDISYGDSFMETRIRYMAKQPNKFRRIFKKYPDRIMIAADLVLTKHAGKTREWIRTQLSAYLDLLTTASFSTDAIKDKTTRQPERLKGLDLPDYLLERILFKNYEDFVAKRPRGTVVLKPRLERMKVPPTGRQAGQAFSPSVKK